MKRVEQLKHPALRVLAQLDAAENVLPRNPAKSFLCPASRSPKKCPTRFPSASVHLTNSARGGPDAGAPPGLQSGILQTESHRSWARSAKASRAPGSARPPGSVAALSSVAFAWPPGPAAISKSFSEFAAIRSAPRQRRAPGTAPAPSPRWPSRPATRISPNLRRRENPLPVFPDAAYSAEWPGFLETAGVLAAVARYP